MKYWICCLLTGPNFQVIFPWPVSLLIDERMMISASIFFRRKRPKATTVNGKLSSRDIQKAAHLVVNCRAWWSILEVMYLLPLSFLFLQKALQRAKLRNEWSLQDYFSSFIPFSYFTFLLSPMLSQSFSTTGVQTVLVIIPITAPTRQTSTLSSPPSLQTTK